MAALEAEQTRLLSEAEAMTLALAKAREEIDAALDELIGLLGWGGFSAPCACDPAGAAVAHGAR
ncbi:MAG: hypothetical protein HC783_16925 [Rhodobacteraceae bacterium]|nr:hypothetical protein [Paracoccaceae bacterium]